MELKLFGLAPKFPHQIGVYRLSKVNFDTIKHNSDFLSTILLKTGILGPQNHRDRAAPTNNLN
jgi:hypothetical protein